MNGLSAVADSIRVLLPAVAHEGGLTSIPVAERVSSPRTRLLMARPSHFRLSGEINPWMNWKQQPDALLAARQWDGLYAALRTTRLLIDVIEQPQAWPDSVFSANAGVALEINGVRTFIPSQFKYSERQGEQALFELAFARRGYRLAHLFDAGESWEGEGDLLEHRGVLFGGYGWRSRVSAHQKVAHFVGLPLIALHLSRPHFYHLDTALAFLDERTALYYPSAFEEASRRQLERYMTGVPGGRLIAVDASDAARFACNVIPVRRQLFMNEVSDSLVARLRERGFEPRRLPLSEFMKSGGAAKCLVQWLPAVRLALRAPVVP